jgi:predicted small secreted protein
MMMIRNRLYISLALAAALTLSACGASAEKGGGNGASAGPPDIKSSGTGAKAAPANSASPTTPTAGGEAARPAASPAGGASDKTPASAPKSQIGSGGNDLYLYTRARAALSADAELNAANIIVDVKEGVGALRGAVASETQKSKAEQIVREAGVKNVRNQLRVAAGN